MQCQLRKYKILQRKAMEESQNCVLSIAAQSHLHTHWWFRHAKGVHTASYGGQLERSPWGKWTCPWETSHSPHGTAQSCTNFFFFFGAWPRHVNVAERNRIWPRNHASWSPPPTVSPAPPHTKTHSSFSLSSAYLLHHLTFHQDRWSGCQLAHPAGSNAAFDTIAI